ncbi:MAG: hypothetical protein ACD_13C00127G0006, partial [uncultured bacterium]
MSYIKFYKKVSRNYWSSRRDKHF